ncbi:MAG: hypothetical protein BMS9Abin07_0452 [Acidimicrobiia bacterium]|nr:MAG: hypothetical protein BMS9Abin07_0452 [Acidimicrobiia bacterium]
MTGAEVHAVIDVVDRLDPQRILVARALDLTLRRRLLASHTGKELPFVYGRTVVPADVGPEDLVVAGHPNSLGVFDLPDAPRWLAVAGPWSSLCTATAAVATVELARTYGVSTAERTLNATKDLANQLDQLRGVTVAFPPQSPVLTVLLSVDPVRVAARMNLPGCVPLTGFPELPGGLTIAPEPVGVEGKLSGYAEALETAVHSVEEVR